MSSDTTRVRNMENLLTLGREEKVPTAGCPSCKAPLISTMAFSGVEFLCLECGRTCGWLDPYKLDSEEAAERMAALQAEWDEHAAGKILPEGRFRRDGCELCTGDSSHREHATPEELAADAEARAWIRERTGRA